MKEENITFQAISKFPLWKKTEINRTPLKFDLELTDRCNNNCRHCYINLPPNDKNAKSKEMSIDKIRHVVDQAASLGTLWCLITGGEPFLREDFFDVYRYLKKKGFLVSVFTNATLITEEHIQLFKKYPPRNLEITVYGVTKIIYENVTRIPGSYEKFKKGLDLLKAAGIPVGLKAVAIRSNFHELDDIFSFCKNNTDTDFRFDPFIHFRYDKNIKRNKEIVAERLTPDEILELEKKDMKRHNAIQKSCEKFSRLTHPDENYREIFICAAGINSFAINSTGYFKICPSLSHPQYMFNLEEYSLSDIWYNMVPSILCIRSNRTEYLEKCAKCKVLNLCMWCPAVAYLETGKLDMPVEQYCKMAHKRKELI